MASTPSSTEDALQTLMGEAKTLVSSGSYQAAIDKYTEALNADSNSHVARHNISICYQRMGEWSKALENVNRALAKDGSKVAKYYSSKGNIMFNLGRREEAKEAWEAGLALEPGNAALAKSLSDLSSAPPPSSSPRAVPAGEGGSSSSNTSGGGPIGSLGRDGYPVVKYAQAEVPSATPLGRVLAALRLVSLLLVLLYLLPLGGSITPLAWRLAMVATAASNVAVLVRDHSPRTPITRDWAALQRIAQEMMMGVMTDLGLPPCIYAIVLALFASKVSPFSLLVAAPALLTNTFYAWEMVLALPVLGGVLVTPSLAVADRLVPEVAGKTGPTRRKELVKGLVRLGAQWEVYAVLGSLALLVTPFGNFGLCSALAGTQYMKYCFNPFTREVLRGIDGRVKTTLALPWVPLSPRLVTAYTWASDYAHNACTKTLRDAQERGR